MRKYLSALIFLATTGVSLAQLPTPADMGLVGGNPNILQTLDSSGGWSTLGTIDPGTHIFVPVSGGGGGSNINCTGNVFGNGTALPSCLPAVPPGSAQNTTGAVVGAAVTLLSARDFINGQGVAIAGAGTGVSALTTTTCTAAASGTTGATSITYYVVTLSSLKGYKAATSCTVANANATLSAQNYVSLTVTPGRVASITASMAGTNVLTVSTIASGILAEGQTVVVAGGVNTRIVGYGTGTGGIGTYIVDSQQTIALEAMTSYAAYAIYKSGGSYGSEAFLSTAGKATYNDHGLASGAFNRPNWLPATHPTVDQADDCVRGILSGGGGTTLTLASACPTNIGSAIVRHDDTAAINSCLSLAGECKLLAGTYTVTGPIFPASNTRLSGTGRGTTIQWYGVQDLFALAGTQASQILSFKAQDFTITGQGTNAYGRKMEVVWSSQFGPIDNVWADSIYDGYHLYNTNAETMTNDRVTNVAAQDGSCFADYSDGNGGGNLSDRRFFYCSFLGGVNYGGKEAKCYWFDGNIQGAQGWEDIEATCPGEAFRVSDDTSTGSAPFGIIENRLSIQYPVGPGIHIMSGARKFACTDCQVLNSGRNNFVDCKSSANLVVENGAQKISITGGNWSAASGDGMYLNGAKQTIRVDSISDNSSTGNGGTAGVCPGLELGPNSNNSTITGGTFGDSTKQSAPGIIDAMAINYSVTGTSAVGGGNNTNHWLNSSPGNGVVACNNGDTFDCVPPAGYGFLAPGSPAGTWLAPTGLASTQIGSVAVNGSVYFTPIYIAQPITLEGFGLKISTNGASTAYAALYAVAGNKPTGDPVMKGSAVNTGGSNTLLTIPADVNYSVTSPGWYYIAIQSGDNTAVYFAPNVVIRMGVFSPAANLTQAFAGTYGFSMVGTAGVWPHNPSGTVAAVTSPTGVVAVWLEIASIP